MGRRQRQRERATGAPDRPRLPAGEYVDADGNTLTLRASLPAPARRDYSDIMTGGLHREDAWQRATELLFERLAVAWTIAGLEITDQRELLGRYRMASEAERRFVRDALREHVEKCFPELRPP